MATRQLQPYSSDARTTLMNARKIYAQIADDPSFTTIKDLIGFEANGIYSIMQHNRFNWEWTKRVTDFVISIWIEDEWYFRCDARGENYTADKDIMAQRARNFLVALGRDPKRKIQTQGFKCKRYMAHWGHLYKAKGASRA